MANKLETIVDANTKSATSLMDLLVRMLWGIWRPVQFYDDASVREATMDSVDLVLKAQRQARSLTDAYQANVFQQMNLHFPDDTGADIADYPRTGVAPEKVWFRPASLYRWLRREGESDQVAREMVLDRVKSMAEEEITLAKRDQSSRVFRKSSITGYRRVIHPELSQTGTCGLCVVASDRIYSKRELLPIHKGCKCDVLPIVGDNDPGDSLNRKDLNELYSKAGGTDRANLSAIRVQSYVSGEIGTVLTRAGVELQDGETRKQGTKRKKLAPSEEENAVTGSDADRFSRPKNKEESLHDLRNRESILNAFVGMHGNDPKMSDVIASCRSQLVDIADQISNLERL